MSPKKTAVRSSAEKRGQCVHGGDGNRNREQHPDGSAGQCHKFGPPARGAPGTIRTKEINLKRLRVPAPIPRIVVNISLIYLTMYNDPSILPSSIRPSELTSD
jgi:hypothetical protein